MKILFCALAAVFLFTTSLFAQTDGALLPEVSPVFLNANGSAPAANGFVCTFAAGTTNLLATYADYNLMTANQNPIRLNAGGRPNNSGTLISIYMQAASYKINIYAAGTGNTCNGVNVGTLIRSIDNVYDLYQLTATGAVRLAIQSFAEAALPPGTTTGRLARVTDKCRGIYMYTGTQWIATNERVCDVKEFGAKGDGSTDDTSAIQTALNVASSIKVFFPCGTYKVTDNLTLNTDQNLMMAGPCAKIQQFTADKNIFKATSKSGISIEGNGGILYGQGGWSNAWVGFSGHEDRCLQFLGVTKSRIAGLHTQNCAVAGITLLGGGDITISDVIVEGTNNYSTPIPAGGNFQAGLYFTDDATYNCPDNITVTGFDISGVAQGVMREIRTAAACAIAASSNGIAMSAGAIHDITGQHATYVQKGPFTLSAVKVSDINSGAIKFQGNGIITGDFAATGIVGANVTGQLFEIEGGIAGGSIVNVELSGSCTACGAGATFTGTISKVIGHFDFQTIGANGNAVSFGGAGPVDMDIWVKAKSIGQDGIICTATGASGIRFHSPLIRDPSTAAASYNGIKVDSASCTLEVFDPVITDTGSKMQYGIYTVQAGSDVKVRGSVTISGAQAYAIRPSGTISEFPTENSLSGTSGKFFSLAGVTSSQTMVVTNQSTSATNVVLWSRVVPTNTVLEVVAEVTGRLSTGAERGFIRTAFLVYRNGGNVTSGGGFSNTQNVTGGGCSGGGAGCVVTYADQFDKVVSASFGGVVSWGVDVGTQQVLLNVNSGGAATTYDWTARVTVTALPY